MAQIQKAVLTEYNDGQVVISNIRKGRGSVPIFGSNETYSATLVDEWWDGTPMDDDKADGDVYFKYIGEEYPEYTGQYFKLNLPNDGELFLEKDTVDELKTMSSTEILLLRMGYYKGVTLNGYYNANDTPAPIQYYLSDTVEVDDGGSVFNVGGIKLEHEFVDRVDVRYFGAVCDGVSDDYLPISNAISKANKIKLYNKHFIGSLLNIRKDIDIDCAGADIISSDENGVIYARGTLQQSLKLKSPYIKGSHKIELEDTSGIEVGQLVNIISPELYNTARLSYYKGGTFEVTRIHEGEIHISEPMPFDINDLDTDVFIYEPIKINMYNAGVISSDSPNYLPQYGIRYWYTKNSSLSSVKIIENYRLNFQVDRSYNTRITNVNTGHAKKPEDTHDGYGLAMYSSNRLYIEGCTLHSGQHGITTSGREVNYNLVIRDSTIKSEIWGLGLGYHVNTYNSFIDNCTIEGFLIGGRCTVINSTVTEGYVMPGRNSAGLIFPSENFEDNQVTFKNVDFKTTVNLRINTATQNLEATNNKVGSIIFDNCGSFYFRSDNAESGASNRDFVIDNITITNCHEGFSIYNFDTINNLSVINSKILSWSKDPSPLIPIDVREGGLIKNVHIDNCYFIPEDERQSNTAFRIRDSDTIRINNFNTFKGDESKKSIFLNIFGSSDVIINNSNIQGHDRSVQYGSTAPPPISFIVNDSNLYFSNNSPHFRDFVAEPINIDLKNVFFNIGNNPEYTRYWNIKTINGEKYSYIFEPNGFAKTQVLVGTTWQDVSSDATPVIKGLVNQSTPTADITTPDATDDIEAIALVNELKEKINAMLTSDRVSGQRAT